MRAIDEADIIPPSSIGMPLPPDDPRATDPGLGFSDDAPTGGDITNNYDSELKPTTELRPVSADALGDDALATGVHAPVRAASEPPLRPSTAPPLRPSTAPPIPMPPAYVPPVSTEIPLPTVTGDDLVPPQIDSRPAIRLAEPPAPRPALPPEPPRPQRSRVPWIVAGALGVAVLAVGGWWAYGEFIAPEPKQGSGTNVVATPTRDAGVKPDATIAATPIDAVVASSTDAAETPSQDAAVVATTIDAAAPADAAVAAATPDAANVKPTPSDQLVITSTPAGARVFLDGSDAGVTPLKQPGSPDRHTIAVLLPGHELYVAQVDGQGQFAIPLKEVTPSGGPAGIKVTRCKDKDRYYVFVDGKPTGQTCPTERIEVELGPHTVEVYDVVSDSRKKYDIEVKDTRLSYRVKIE
jgi:hypothetical protein